MQGEFHIAGWRVQPQLNQTYLDQVGREILFVPKCDDCAAWPASFKPASDTVRIGYVLDGTTAPYVRDLGHGNLGGLDVQLASIAVSLINGHYGLALRIVWVPAPAGSGSLLSRLYQGLVEHRYDIVMSGQMILPASDLPPGEPARRAGGCGAGTAAIHGRAAPFGGKAWRGSLAPEPARRRVGRGLRHRGGADQLHLGPAPRPGRRSAGAAIHSDDPSPGLSADRAGRGGRFRRFGSGRAVRSLLTA